MTSFDAIDLPPNVVNDALRMEYRFVEMSTLLMQYIESIIGADDELLQGTARQILNVVKKCDQISFEEYGVAEAYAIIHFLDRFHRFQLIFDQLSKDGLLQFRSRRFDALDIGTGPGPSMYALSDFLLRKQTGVPGQYEENCLPSFTIDYVERSAAFRNWLHRFTEFANAKCYSQVKWRIPYHHGTFSDFAGIQLDSLEAVSRRLKDGRIAQYQKTVKRRYDLIVLSNFLTTREMVERNKSEIQSCVRALRNGGIFLVVGARSSSAKYQDIYTRLDEVVLGGIYSNWKLRAWCRRVNLQESTMRYSWGDDWGKWVKAALDVAFAKLITVPEADFCGASKREFSKRMSLENSKAIEWEVIVYRKHAIPKSKWRTGKL